MGFAGWLIGIAAVLLGVVAIVVVRRQRYLRAVRGRGWIPIANPGLEQVWDHHAPPFGMGWQREVSKFVRGTTAAGREFRWFEYQYSGAGPDYSGRLLSVAHQADWPAVWITMTGYHRTGVGDPESVLHVVKDEKLSVVSADPGLATAVFSRVSGMLPQLAGLGPLDLSLEPAGLVMASAPKQPAALQPWLEAADSLLAALNGLVGPVTVPPVGGFSFFDQPDWILLGSDPAVLGIYPVERQGENHQVRDLVRGQRDGIRLDAFWHDWQTSSVMMQSNPDGSTSTQIVTEDHSAAVCGFVLPFELPAFSVNGDRVGQKVTLESQEFNRRFRVRSASPRFASDVLHPRTMEWLLNSSPPGWTVNGRVVHFEVTDHDQLQVEACQTALRGWLGRIPRFVWHDLGLTVPPFHVE